MLELIDKLNDVLDFSNHRVSDMLPSKWAESRMRVTTGKFQGPLNFDRTPFMREILDCFYPYHPATDIILQGGSQLGKTRAIIEPLIAYYISERPCNMGYLTGHSELSEESILKLDTAIDNAGLRDLIKNHSLRKRNSRTGDTNKSKEFSGYRLTSGSATNHKFLRQFDWMVIVADDIEAAKGSSKESGSTVKMIERRAASYGNSRKIFWCSTPELEETSIIAPLFKSGDQRLWHIPCECCGAYIVLQWSIDLDGGEKAGMTWKADEYNRLIPGTVGYICQECGGFFTERNKYEMNLAGQWIAQAVPDDPLRVSFKLPGLYATPGMVGWDNAVRDYLKAYNPAQPDEALQKTFVNLTLGETFKSTAESPQAMQIMKNQRPYEIGTIPETMSINDGNGRIVLLTCAADMNGKVDDARLDYEIVAWSESGSTYSILHGSIGTFIPRENTLKEKVDREHWTYDFNVPNSVWPEFEKILSSVFYTDGSREKRREMRIMITGLDCGYLATTHAYPFLDSTNQWVIGLKSSKDEKYLMTDANKALFRNSLEKPGVVYLPESGLIKDMISGYMALKWNGPVQPDNFMNYPDSADGLYQLNNFFEHYQAEHRTVVTKDGNSKFRWVKKNTALQNHLWDCRVYNIAVREIFIHLTGKELDIKGFSWKDYVAMLAG